MVHGTLDRSEQPEEAGVVADTQLVVKGKAADRMVATEKALMVALAEAGHMQSDLPMEDLGPTPQPFRTLVGQAAPTMLA
jgi:hypothetical protein